MSEPMYKYLFGPVPSRRLGRSLGVDITPLKTCTQNCIYCQLGKDAATTLARKAYVPIESVLIELKTKIASGLEADFITLSGSGEPTLHSQFGKLIDGIRKLTEIPVAVITNSTLLSDSSVRSACCKADVVLPSLDAGSTETFVQMNHPHHDLDFETFVDGLIRFRFEYTGQIWLEVFFCEGVNTSESAISNLKKWIDKIKPDKIQVNTAVRPVVDSKAVRVEQDRLNQIAKLLNPRAEVIASFSKPPGASRKADTNTILETLQRRPCSLTDLCQGLGVSEQEVRKSLNTLVNEGKIVLEENAQKKYYKPL